MPSDAGHATVADEDEAGAEVPVEDPETLEDPVEVPEEPVEVLEDPVGVLEDPVGVLEDPVGVLEDPVEVLEDPVEVLGDNFVESDEAVELATDEEALAPTELDVEVVVRMLYDCQPTALDLFSKPGVRVTMETHEAEPDDDKTVEEPSRVRKRPFTASQ